MYGYLLHSRLDGDTENFPVIMSRRSSRIAAIHNTNVENVLPEKAEESCLTTTKETAPLKDNLEPMSESAETGLSSLAIMEPDSNDDSCLSSTTEKGDDSAITESVELIHQDSTTSMMTEVGEDSIMRPISPKDFPISQSMLTEDEETMDSSESGDLMDSTSSLPASASMLTEDNDTMGSADTDGKMECTTDVSKSQSILENDETMDSSELDELDDHMHSAKNFPASLPLSAKDDETLGSTDTDGKMECTADLSKNQSVLTEHGTAKEDVLADQMDCDKDLPTSLPTLPNDKETIDLPVSLLVSTDDNETTGSTDTDGKMECTTDLSKSQSVLTEDGETAKDDTLADQMDCDKDLPAILLTLPVDRELKTEAEETTGENKMDDKDHPISDETLEMNQVDRLLEALPSAEKSKEPSANDADMETECNVSQSESQNSMEIPIPVVASLLSLLPVTTGRDVAEKKRSSSKTPRQAMGKRPFTPRRSTRSNSLRKAETGDQPEPESLNASQLPAVSDGNVTANSRKRRKTMVPSPAGVESEAPPKKAARNSSIVARRESKSHLRRSQRNSVLSHGTSSSGSHATSSSTGSRATSPASQESVDVKADTVLETETAEVPESPVAAVEEQPKKRQSRKDDPNKTYAEGKYPMKLLAADSFKSEKIPENICQDCMLNKIDDKIDGCLVQCSGPCKRFIHWQCMDPGIHLPSDVEVPKTMEAIEAVKEKLYKDGYQCVECQTNVRECFKCEKKGNDLIKCPVPDCCQFFHHSCLVGESAPPDAKPVPCGHHECHTCNISGRKAKDGAFPLSKCVLCPRAFHFNFMCFPIEADVSPDNHGYCACWEHVPNDEDEKRKGKKKRANVGIDLKICLTCNEGGELMVCKSCPVTQHAECAGLDEIPEEDWTCHDCAKGKRPLLLDIVWHKFGVHRPWPCQIVPVNTAPRNVQAIDCYGLFCMRFLGTNEYSFAQGKDILPFDICDPKWKKKGKAPKNFIEGLKEAYRLYQEVLKVKTDFVARSFTGVMGSYLKIRANKPVEPVRYGGRALTDYEYICHCKATDPDPCGPTSNCVNRSTEIECHPKHCPAGKSCQNQRIRKKRNAKLKVFYTADRGWGLMATGDIKKGDLVIEYCGEIITVEERNRRLREKLATGDVNFYYLDLTNNRVIDAGPAGNDARFANHSCDANTSSQKWMIDGETHIALMAIKDIKKGDEITFDYRWEYESGVTLRECLCGAENCQGKIGGKELRTKSVESEENEAETEERPKKRQRKSKKN